MDDLDLRMLAIDVADGLVFTNYMLKEEEVARHFLPILLGAGDDMTKEQLDDIGIIYEYRSEALPTMINGMPVFKSFRYLNKADTDKLRVWYAEIKALKQKFKEGKAE